MAEFQITSCPPRTEIDWKSYGYIAYGIKAEITSRYGPRLPLRLFIGLHSWRWRAVRATKRWLRENGANRG